MGGNSSKQFHKPVGVGKQKQNDDDCVCNFLFSILGLPPNTFSEKDLVTDIGTPLPDTPTTVMKNRALYEGLESEENFTMNNDINVTVNGNHVINEWNSGINHNAIAKGIQVKNANDLAAKYQLFEILGVGSTSVCHRCIQRSTRKAFACKIIDKRQIEHQFNGMIDQFHSEIEALRSLNHPNIIALYDVYTTVDKIYIVMELMEGGELFDYVVKKGTLTEEEASKIVRMVTSALVYMHGENIIHRDLKPENLMLTHRPTSAFDIEVKIIDFGLCKTMHEPEASSFLGTRGYLAPEMLQRRFYSRAVDTWALGVLTFVLVCGCLPFDDDTSAVKSDAVIQSKFRLRFPSWSRNLSSSARDVLSHLLDINPNTRYTAEQAMRHPWVSGSTAGKNSLKSPGRMKKSNNNINSAAANRLHMQQMMAGRVRAGSFKGRQRQIIRKKSI